MENYVAAFNNASDVYSSVICKSVCVFVFSRGRYLVALGRSWHPEEFTCSQCKAVLDEGGFFEERGSVYCTKCHDNRYAPNCAKCKKKITGVRAALLHEVKSQTTNTEGVLTRRDILHTSLYNNTWTQPPSYSSNTELKLKLNF